MLNFDCIHMVLGNGSGEGGADEAPGCEINGYCPNCKGCPDLKYIDLRIKGSVLPCDNSAYPF